MSDLLLFYTYESMNLLLMFTFAYSAKMTQRLANVHLTPNKLTRPPELLFCWGVYFSGLIPLASLALAKCRANCLIFQLNGEHFTSPALISEQGLHAQLRLHYQRYDEHDRLLLRLLYCCSPNKLNKLFNWIYLLPTILVTQRTFAFV